MNIKASLKIEDKNLKADFAMDNIEVSEVYTGPDAWKAILYTGFVHWILDGGEAEQEDKVALNGLKIWIEELPADYSMAQEVLQSQGVFITIKIKEEDGNEAEYQYTRRFLGPRIIH